MRSVERLLAGLDARLHADHVADLVAAAADSGRSESRWCGRSCARLCASHAVSSRAGGFGFEKRAQFAGERGVVSERILLGVRLEEEIERIEDRHFGDQVDFDEELGGGLREDQAREIVALRVLLPVDEVVLRAGSSANRTGSGVRQCGAGRKPHDLRAESDPRGRIGIASYDSAQRESP